MGSTPLIPEGADLSLRVLVVDDHRDSADSLGLLLAIEAARLAPSKEANEALYAALDTCREQRTLFGHTGPVLSARFTPDGSRILSCAQDEVTSLLSTDPHEGEDVTGPVSHMHPGTTPRSPPDGPNGTVKSR